jgi:hypothetical protein
VKAEKCKGYLAFELPLRRKRYGYTGEKEKKK